MINNESMISGLKSEIRRLEDEKRTIDDKIVAITTVLQHFESQGNSSPENGVTPPIAVEGDDVIDVPW